jgi:hypothetical protein
MSREPRPRQPLVVAIMAVALLAYSVVALSVGSRWISGLLAPVVAWLLWRRHPRARFAAYIFLSGVGLRSAVAGQWTTLLFAAGAIVVLQTSAARRAWPRLVPRWPWRQTQAGGDGEGGDRMARS